MPENKYWQRILDAKFTDAYSNDFKARLYWFLQGFAHELCLLNKEGHSDIITADRFGEICDRTRPHARFIDHITLNVGYERLERVVEIALLAGFQASDYFFPLDDETGMISIVLGNPQEKMYVAVNEGLDGW
ncbi:MAG: hypothetical protein HYW88_01260, partial [Candidatus Sungbacteria bacterium]|nr:hypothetical protein [Candidatus Sungbacteria bacterium]